MPDNNRPRARQKTVSSGGSGVHRRGSGLGTGPVGRGSGGSYSSGGGGGGISRGALGGGGIGLIAIILIVAKLFGGGGSSSVPDGYGQGGSGGATYMASTAGEVDRTVASGSRAKYTAIKGNGDDKVTLMVYMCGTDLESKHGMASNDLQEMAAATIGKNVNVIVMTGGCKQWKINSISNSVNQIFRVTNGKLEQLESDMGTLAMTDPNNLSAFIKYCAKNYPADRNELILWDHGGGSVSGYGYDEKNKAAGAMDLGGISRALDEGGIKFDFVGFDACLMATAETALMLNDYADYMIASEETEPGIGWYYTDWLTALSKNTSMATIDLGKMIVDSFVEKCAQRCPGQGTTLSVVDLAEFSNTVPDKLGGFSKSVTGLLSDKQYKTVSDARYGTREFAISSKIDQVDLADLSQNIGTDEGEALARTDRQGDKGRCQVQPHLLHNVKRLRRFHLLPLQAHGICGQGVQHLQQDRHRQRIQQGDTAVRKHGDYGSGGIGRYTDPRDLAVRPGELYRLLRQLGHGKLAAFGISFRRLRQEHFGAGRRQHRLYERHGAFGEGHCGLYRFQSAGSLVACVD